MQGKLFRNHKETIKKLAQTCRNRLYPHEKDRERQKISAKARFYHGTQNIFVYIKNSIDRAKLNYLYFSKNIY